jgi:hypothetical protein
MSKTVTAILFDELLNRPDYMRLFLTMHNGFSNFYTAICKEFYSGCLLPNLKAEISKHNASVSDCHKLILNPNTADELSKKYGGLTISSKSWEDTMTVYLDSGETLGYNSFNAGVYDTKDDFGGMSDSFEKQFNKHFNNSFCNLSKGNKTVYCDFPHRSWSSPEMFLVLCKDVLERRNSELALLPTADRFVNLLMELAAITDEVVKEAGTGRSE